jgi:hypothetical protein
MKKEIFQADNLEQIRDHDVRAAELDDEKDFLKRDLALIYTW